MVRSCRQEQEVQEAVTYHLEPGFIYASAENTTIRTVVGSCVAVCLWDELKQWGGMNHFIYPEIFDKNKTTAQYGNVAMLALIRLLEKMGSSRKNLVAQVYGGAHLHELTNHNVGLENIAIARKILKQKHIRTISEDVGGRMGRKILFDTITGHTAILKVHRLRREDWIELK